MKPFLFSSLVLALPFALLACAEVQTETGLAAASSDLSVACQKLYERRVAYEKSCPGFPRETPDAKSALDSCIGIATAPGSLLEVEEIDACADELGNLACEIDGYPSCMGYGAHL